MNRLDRLDMLISAVNLKADEGKWVEATNRGVLLADAKQMGLPPTSAQTTQAHDAVNEMATAARTKGTP